MNMKGSFLKILVIFIFLISFQAQALTCEQEFALRSEKETQVIKSLVQLQTKTSEISKTSTSPSISYQQKLKEQILSARTEIYDFIGKFQRLQIKNKDHKSEPVDETATKKKQRVRTGDFKETLTLNGHVHSVVTIAELRDGRLVSGSHDRTLRVWTLNSDGTYSSQELFGHLGSVHKVIELKNGKIASASRDHLLRIWTLNPDGTYSSIALIGHTKTVRDLIELEDGRIVSASEDSTVRIWTLKSDGTYSSSILDNTDGSLGAFTKLKDGRFASSGPGRSLRLWTPSPDGTYSWQDMKHPSKPISFIAELKDGRIVSLSDESLRVWTVKPDGSYHSVELTLPGYTNPIMTDGIALEDGRIISVASGGTLRIWTLNPNDTYSSVEMKEHIDLVNTVTQLKDGRLVTGVSFKGAIKIWTPEFIEIDEL